MLNHVIRVSHVARANMRMYATVILHIIKGRSRLEFVPLPWVTLHWAVGVLLYNG